MLEPKRISSVIPRCKEIRQALVNLVF